MSEMNVDEVQLPIPTAAPAHTLRLVIVLVAALLLLRKRRRTELHPLLKDEHIWERIAGMPDRQYEEIFGFTRDVVKQIIERVDIPLQFERSRLRASEYVHLSMHRLRSTMYLREMRDMYHVGSGGTLAAAFQWFRGRVMEQYTQSFPWDELDASRERFRQKSTVST
jgi:hypothetical protein